MPGTVFEALQWVERKRQEKLTAMAREKCSSAEQHQVLWVVACRDERRPISTVKGKTKRVDPSTSACNLLKDLLSRNDLKGYLRTLDNDTLAFTLAELGGVAFHVKKVNDPGVVYGKTGLIAALGILLKQVTRLGIDKLAL